MRDDEADNNPCRILDGDCLDRLNELPAGGADLVYLDPPFNTGRAQRDRAGAYADRWPSIDDYLGFLRPRIEAAIRILQPHGIMLLHCDWRTSHHMRRLLDELLGSDRFVNHLIWQYGLGGSSARRFARKHDDILFYALSDGYHFEPPMVPATSRRMEGRLKKASDVIAIPAINNMARERTGYPTQKPLALMTLLIKACCPPGGLVVDPFCGSGTTPAAALACGRRAVGIDANPEATAIARRRIDELIAAEKTAP